MKKTVSAATLPLILKTLEEVLSRKKTSLHLLVGGAGAMVGAYAYPEQTTDIDAIPLAGSFEHLATELQEVALKLDLPGDWINPHYKTFTIYLPSDYRSRTREIYKGPWLQADALGPEDLMIMKFMAGRTKDESHLRFLMAQSPQLKIIETRLEELLKLFPKEAAQALELFDEITNP